MGEMTRVKAIRLKGIVEDKTIGAGVDDDMNIDDLIEIETRYGTALTTEEIQFVEAEWKSCQQQMVQQ